MDISIIIPARNAASIITACVGSLKNQTFRGGRLEILVVDDGSSDETAETARSAGAEVISIPPSKQAAARNRGVERARGEILLFTDADCIPAPDWVERMVEPFQGADVIATKGAYRTGQSSLTARFVQSEYESRYRRTAKRQTIDFIDTYAAGFRRQLFQQVGGFDEAYEIGEDQEFSFRYSRLGGRMVFVADAVVSHLHADTPLKYFRKKLRIGYWKMRVVGRHPDKVVDDSHTPQLLKLEMVAVLVALVSTVGILHPVGLTICLLACGAFLASAVPHAVTLGRRDRWLGLAAVGFLFLRGLALGIGTITGLAAGAATFLGSRGDRRETWLRRLPLAAESERTAESTAEKEVALVTEGEGPSPTER